MRKKRERLILSILIGIFVICCLSLSEAAVNTSINTSDTANFEKSYTCLKDKVNSRISEGMTTEELSFSMLALAYDSTLKQKIKVKLDELGNGNCWPKSSCTLKETSMATLAMKHIGENTDRQEAWLLNQTAAASDLAWYLQIDSDSSQKAQCTLTYSGNSKTITVNEDKTITGSPGSCFSLAYNGVWLEVASSCYGKEFEISCDKDFLTSLIYKRRSGQTYYVSSITNTAAPGGKTTEKVESLCFKQGGVCSYEGTLWASMVLQKLGNDISEFVPYLLTLAPDNKRYNPSAFLYILTTGYDEYFTNLINDQNREGYWQYSEASRRYYDTALSIFALGDNDASAKAKEYLLTPKVQQEGCYNNNIRDTAFVVYAASPKSASTVIETKRCQDSGFYCITSAKCEEANGTRMLDYSGCLTVNICCSKNQQQRTCSQENGVICTSNQNCEGDFVPGLDRCCKGTCVAKEQEEEEEDECSPNGEDYICKMQCSDSEESTNDICPAEGVCCKVKEKSSYWWLWLLIILVILLVLAILFRNQLKIFTFKTKSNFSNSPMPSQSRPPFPPSNPSPFGGPRRIIPGMAPRPMIPQRPMNNLPPRQMPKPFPKEKELDETLKKLKDMSGR